MRVSISDEDLTVESIGVEDLLDVFGVSPFLLCWTSIFFKALLSDGRVELALANPSPLYFLIARVPNERESRVPL